MKMNKQCLEQKEQRHKTPSQGWIKFLFFADLHWFNMEGFKTEALVFQINLGAWDQSK